MSHNLSTPGPTPPHSHGHTRVHLAHAPRRRLQHTTRLQASTQGPPAGDRPACPPPHLHRIPAPPAAQPPAHPLAAPKPRSRTAPRPVSWTSSRRQLPCNQLRRLDCRSDAQSYLAASSRKAGRPLPGGLRGVTPGGQGKPSGCGASEPNGPPFTDGKTKAQRGREHRGWDPSLRPSFSTRTITFPAPVGVPGAAEPTPQWLTPRQTRKPRSKRTQGCGDAPPAPPPPPPASPWPCPQRHLPSCCPRSLESPRPPGLSRQNAPVPGPPKAHGERPPFWGGASPCRPGDLAGRKALGTRDTQG